MIKNFLNIFKKNFLKIEDEQTENDDVVVEKPEIQKNVLEKHTKQTLSVITKSKLIELAKNEFDLSLNIKTSKDDMIDKILESQK